MSCTCHDFLKLPDQVGSERAHNSVAVLWVGLSLYETHTQIHQGVKQGLYHLVNPGRFRAKYKVLIFLSTMPISSPNPMLDHLLELSD